MIIVDNALRKLEVENSHIKVAMVGAGSMAKAVAYQICKYTPGMVLVAIANRHPVKAKAVFEAAGLTEAEEVENISGLEKNVRLGVPSVCNNPLLLTGASNIDVIIEVTGTVEYSAKVTLNALKRKKHVVLINSALDATVGPILKVYAHRSGMVLTNTDGNAAATTMLLYRHVKSLGFEPVFCGNIHAGESSYLTQISVDTLKCFDQAMLANATGMQLPEMDFYSPYTYANRRSNSDIGILGSDERIKFPDVAARVEALDPCAGVFILAKTDDPVQQAYLSKYKLDGYPLYLFKLPFQMAHFEVANTVAKAVLFKDASISPIDKPYVEVVAAAGRDINAGEILDGIAGDCTFGVCRNAEDVQSMNFLPIGVAENCIIKRNVPKDQILTYDDVILPEGRLIDMLRMEQNEYFAVQAGCSLKTVHK
jgi:predicted homoserine dehydrogenase-like protein